MLQTEHVNSREVDDLSHRQLDFNKTALEGSRRKRMFVYIHFERPYFIAEQGNNFGRAGRQQTWIF